MERGVKSVPPAPAYRVSPADPAADRERILALWREGLAQKGIPGGKLDWYYLRNPEGTPEVVFLHAAGAPEAIGVACMSPRRMRIGAETAVAGTLVDFVVTPEHRSFFPHSSSRRSCAGALAGASPRSSAFPTRIRSRS